MKPATIFLLLLLSFFAPLTHSQVVTPLEEGHWRVPHVVRMDSATINCLLVNQPSLQVETFWFTGRESNCFGAGFRLQRGPVIASAGLMHNAYPQHRTGTGGGLHFHAALGLYGPVVDFSRTTGLYFMAGLQTAGNAGVNAVENFQEGLRLGHFGGFECRIADKFFVNFTHGIVFNPTHSSPSFEPDPFAHVFRIGAGMEVLQGRVPGRKLPMYRRPHRGKLNWDRRDRMRW